LFESLASRLPRLFFVGAFSVTILASLSGANALLLGSKHHDPAGTCSVALGSVVNGQQRLLVKATGLAPSSSYVEAQAGVQSAMVTSDATGAISDQSLWFHGSGLYSIAVNYYYWRNNQLVQTAAASCSAQL
jgi:hypothetical protein